MRFKKRLHLLFTILNNDLIYFKSHKHLDQIPYISPKQTRLLLHDLLCIKSSCEGILEYVEKIITILENVSEQSTRKR